MNEHKEHSLGEESIPDNVSQIDKLAASNLLKNY